MTQRKVRAAIAAVAGTTVGVGTVAVAIPANASTTVTTTPVTTTPVAAAAAADIPPICDSWSDFANIGGSVAHVPTFGRNSFNDSCVLVQDTAHVRDGVTKLQIALNLCYGAGLDVDGRYGPQTAAKVLVKLQQHFGLPETGIYTQAEAVRMLFPTYIGDQWTGACHPS